MNIPIARIASKGIRTLITPIELNRLGRNNREYQQSLAETIRKARRSDFTEEEQEWIDKIESTRSGLLASDQTIKADNFLKDDAQHGKTDKSNVENVSDVCYASVSPSYGRLLHKLVRDYTPQKCLELGTCLGISTAFISSAISLNGKGHLVTLEGSPSRSTYAESVLNELGLPDIEYVIGPFNQTLEPLLESYQNIDFCYIDGHHDGRATIEYFDTISGVLTDGAIVVIDDITWSDDMNRAWNTIRDKQKVVLTVDTYMMGICLIGKENAGNQKAQTEKQSYKIMYW
jgi:predicted O-methyltransferase YrrM